MDERDKVLEHLEKTVLGTSPGSKESIEALKAYNEYIRNENERIRVESEQRLKKEIHEDELVRNRDQAMIDDAHFKHEKLMDYINIGLKAAGMICTGLWIGKAIQDDKDGKPWLGIARDFLSNLIRKSG